MYEPTTYTIPATICDCRDSFGERALYLESAAIRCLNAEIEDGELVADFDDSDQYDDDHNAWKTRLYCATCKQRWVLDDKPSESPVPVKSAPVADVSANTVDIIDALCSGCDEIQPCKLIPVNEGAWWELACSSCMEETGIDKDAIFAEVTPK